MSTQCVDLSVEGLINRAHDIDRFLALYRAELARIPADDGYALDAVRTEIEELEDLLLIVEDLWEAVSGRTARLYEEVQNRVVAESEVHHELATHSEKLRRCFTFAAAAGIRVPAPVN